ncbi:MAG: gas vesicle protein GvpG [Thermoanaerobaculia bacterium]
MLVFDKLLVSGLKFVFDKVATIADGERNDAERVREALLATQVQLEDGLIDDATFRERETELIARLREIRAAQRDDDPTELRVTGVEARFVGDEGAEREVAVVPARRAGTLAVKKTKKKKKARRARKP